MKVIKMIIFVFLFIGAMVPLIAYEAQIDGISLQKSVQEHIEVKDDDDEREKKDNSQLEQTSSDEKYA